MKLPAPLAYLRAHDEWIAFAFAAILGLITMVPITASGNDAGRIMVYICFLPMSFFYAASALVQTRARVKELEARIAELEKGRVES